MTTPGSPKSPIRAWESDEIFEYWAGNPSVEIQHGHILARSAKQREHRSPSGRPHGITSISEQIDTSGVDSIALASSIPCHMSAAEFCDFLGAFGPESHRQFRHCRVLHGRNTEEYLMAILMASPEEAAALVEEFDGQRYNKIEAAQCRLHRVISFRGPPASGDEPTSPAMLARLRSPKPKMAQTPPEVAQGQIQMSPLFLPSSGSAADISPVPSPPLPEASVPVSSSPLLFDGGLVSGTAGTATNEKPFCAVCLETVDTNPADYQLTEMGGGVPLTILCGHTFHARCLSCWCDTSCPVCRFQQHPCQASCCDVCGQVDGVHICLVCGFIGCAAAEGEGHAKQHFEATSHAYALEVNTQHVWDYAGNGYVHRLLYNDQDGKMVEHTLPHSEAGGAAPSDTATSADASAGEALKSAFGGNLRWADMDDDDLDKVIAALSGNGLARESAPSSSSQSARAKKQESVVSEFNALLSSQMTAQRHYFDELRQELEMRNCQEMQELEEQRLHAVAAADEVQRDLDAMLAEAAGVEKRIAEAAAAEALAQRQRQQLETLNSRISGEQQLYEERQGDKEEQKKAARQHRDREVAELQQEIKDLELFLQMRHRCQSSVDAAELQESHLLVTDSGLAKGRSGRKTRKR